MAIDLGQKILRVKDLDEPWRIYPICDIHPEEQGSRLDLVHERIEQLAGDDHGFGAGLGDVISGISVRDPRFDEATLSEEGRKSIFERLGDAAEKWAIETFSRAGKGKWLLWLMGNHEYEYEKQRERKLSEHVAEKIGAPFGGFCCITDLIFRHKTGDTRFRVFAHHGAGSARKPGAKMCRLYDFMSESLANLYMIGHLHSTGSHAAPMLTRSDGPEIGLRTYQRLGVICGTALETYHEGTVPSYAERKGLPPTELGWPIISIVPRTLKIRLD